MIFEYAPRLLGGTYGLGQKSSAIMALIYLGIGSLAWIAFIYWYYRKYIKSIGREVQNVKSILREGKLVTARINEKNIEKDLGALQELGLEISFNNLSGTRVHIPYPITDTRPYERRYEIGKTIQMRLDPQLRNPVIVPDGVEVQTMPAYTRQRTFGFVALVFFSIFYLIFSYWLQNEGMGWRFLHFWHPWVTIPFWGLFFGWLLFDLLIGRLLDGMNPVLSSKDNELLFIGKVTRAQVIAAEQTGLTVNEQPQIRFKLRFIDDHGQMRIVSFKKIISLLRLHTLQSKEKTILYSPEDPTQVMFAEEFVDPQ